MCEKCCCRNKINDSELFEYLRTWLESHHEFVKNSGAGLILATAMRKSTDDLLDFFGLEWVSYNGDYALKTVLDYKRAHLRKNG